jgi:hypothetical protein
VTVNATTAEKFARVTGRNVISIALSHRGSVLPATRLSGTIPLFGLGHLRGLGRESPVASSAVFLGFSED